MLKLNMKQRIALIIAWVSMVFVNGSSSQSSDLSLSKTGLTAYKKLLKVGTFSIGPTGYAAQTSQGELAFRQVLSEERAISAFKNLLNQATPEGQLYALLGLYLKDQDEFKQAVKPYISDPQGEEKVRTQLGCEVFQMPLREEVIKIESGEYNYLLKKD